MQHFTSAQEEVSFREHQSMTRPLRLLCSWGAAYGKYNCNVPVVPRRSWWLFLFLFYISLILALHQ